MIRFTEIHCFILYLFGLHFNFFNYVYYKLSKYDTIHFTVYLAVLLVVQEHKNILKKRFLRNQFIFIPL